MDKPCPTREQIRQLLVLVLELLTQDIDTETDSAPLPASARHVDDIELAEAEALVTQVEPGAALPLTDRPDEVEMDYFSRRWRRK